MLSLLLSSVLVAGCSAACTTFPEVEEFNYDRNYSYIASDDRRPLGFLKSTVIFNADGEVCFSVDGASDRFVELMFEVVPSQVLCFEDQTGRKRCHEGRFSECRLASADQMAFTFFCDVSEGCSESDVTFWLRITKGPTSAEDSEDMWCHWRTGEFPEDLAEIPLGFSPAPLPSEKPVDGASALSVSIVWITSLLAVLL
ncbi:hypothetical protein CAPTEDRAFT_222671 [Capitella teleta]|uniref:CUB domain-containing protein n=1 Tax=Capitella teleta TaxID=283909 RepID=R7TP40_CAPTE|nr:hypothetical protein CAPTEDRAFT_222671 [Capitella teleta]|eukprot:ELT95673.1 hypothetical protein CAPTEDRAFT_222671 [Capitella teleta]